MAKVGRRISTHTVMDGGYPLDGPKASTLPLGVGEVDCIEDVCIQCSQKAIVQKMIDDHNNGEGHFYPKYKGNENMYEDEEDNLGNPTGWIVLKTPISPEYREKPKVKDWLSVPPHSYNIEEWQGRTIKTISSYGTVARGSYGTANNKEEESWLEYNCYCCGSKLVDPSFGTWE
tara:strand:+ start:2753 stop:3274 length:522 start_codon:yes stop_codon:yes gene_type:complete